MANDWYATREEAIRRLETFAAHAGSDYQSFRNYDLGAGQHSHVSVLSPWIRHRIISEQEVVQKVLEQHSLNAAEKFVQEVFWRTYWKGWLELRPAVWDQYQQERNHWIRQLERDSDLNQRWTAACEGATEIECLNAWTQELTQTGYLHNHARMWFASIWIFTLKLPWELGADFFLRNLLDGDAASNTLSWRWVAGLQTKGKAYTAAASNIAKFTKGRFRPNAHELAAYAEPVVGDDPPPAGSPPAFDAPSSELTTGTLLTEEDLSARRTGPVSYVVATQHRSVRPVAQHVSDFVSAAFDDVAKRHGPITNVTAANVLDWATQHQLQQVIVSYIPVGPTRCETNQIFQVLTNAGIRVCQTIRNWDAKAWPHATRGFFPFKKKIPKLVRAMTAE